MAKTIATYREFWPFYLSEHSKRGTRALHYLGTTGFIAIAIFAFATDTWSALAWAVVNAYAFAWFSHFAIEHNKPATFTYPFWSLISDFRMLGYAAGGKIGAELTKYQVSTRP